MASNFKTILRIFLTAMPKKNKHQKDALLRVFADEKTPLNP